MTKRILAITLCMLLLAANFIFANAAAPKSIEAPTNLSVELKTHADGYPYFELKLQVPASIEALYSTAEDDGAALFFETEYKVGNGEWTQTGGVLFDVGPVFVMNPDDMGLGADVDIKANIYSFRVKFGYYPSEGTDENGNKIAGEPISSPFSNEFSVGIAAYQKSYKEASTWAEAELDKAAEYGFITDKIKDKMNGPITREELCEVIMKLYEKIIGQAQYKDLTAFEDTQNPEIYKAFELGIVNGVGNNKFAPKELTNREQVAAMMYRAVKAIKPDADFSIVGTESFADESIISTWALDSVKFMNKNGFIKGSNGYVSPKDTTTREQAVLIVLRTYEKYSK